MCGHVWLHSIGTYWWLVCLDDLLDIRLSGQTSYTSTCLIILMYNSLCDQMCLVICTHSAYATYLISNINLQRLVLTSQSTLCHQIIIVPTTEVAIKSSGSKWWSLGKKCALGDRETHSGRAHERLLRMMCCILRWSYMISECTG